MNRCRLRFGEFATFSVELENRNRVVTTIARVNKLSAGVNADLGGAVEGLASFLLGGEGLSSVQQLHAAVIEQLETTHRQGKLVENKDKRAVGTPFAVKDFHVARPATFHALNWLIESS